MDPSRFKATQWGEVRRTIGPFGYYSYHPASLPRRLQLEDETVFLLSEADLALGRLGGAGRLLPTPELLIAPYVRLEALSSSRIEGTQASLSDLFDATATGTIPSSDIREVLNYVAALNHGLRLLANTLPLSLRLMREMHIKLLEAARGSERTPGEFRASQNWIGSPDDTLERAVFVPPPVDVMHESLRDWESFQHQKVSIPLLVQCGMLHYQFETIHPFLDGNGRLGRLFIILYLVERGPLLAPLLYLSSYFEEHKAQYYDSLQLVREQGHMQGWLRFFLRAVAVQATDAVERAERLVDLREKYRAQLSRTRSNAHQVIDLMLKNPILTARYIAQELHVTPQTGLNLLRQLESLGMLRQVSDAPGPTLRWTADEVQRMVFARNGRPA
jgi:Fic family protein